MANPTHHERRECAGHGLPAVGQPKFKSNVAASPNVVIWGARHFNDGLRSNADQIYRDLALFSASGAKFCDRASAPCSLSCTWMTFMAIQRRVRQADNMQLSYALNRLQGWNPDQVWVVSLAQVVGSYTMSHLVNVTDELVYLDSRGLQTHPGLSHHVLVSWMVWYNLLLGMHRYCRTPVHENDARTKLTSLPGLYRPPLTPTLKLADVTQAWQNASRQGTATCRNAATNVDAVQRCAYAWMSVPLAGVTGTAGLQRIMSRHLTQNNGWRPEGNAFRGVKLGWDATVPNATFALSIPVVASNVWFLTVLVLTSYGPKFTKSEVAVTARLASNKQSVWQDTFRMPGYHDDPSSIIIPHKFALPAADGDKKPGGQQQQVFVFRLIGGSTFKIMGITLRSR